MKEFKFRYKTLGGAYHYEVFELPDDAVQLIGYDLNGQEVYDGDKLWDYRDATSGYAALNAFSYSKYSPPHRPCRLRTFNCIKKND